MPSRVKCCTDPVGKDGDKCKNFTKNSVEALDLPAAAFFVAGGVVFCRLGVYNTTAKDNTGTSNDAPDCPET